MLKKIIKSILICAFLFSGSTIAHAQGMYLTHAINGGVLIPNADMGFEQAPFIGYAPRLVLKELGTSSSIGLNSYINVGIFNRKSDLPGFFELTSNTTFVSAPLLLQYNIGAGATKYAESAVGFYAGAGIDYSTFFTSITTSTVGFGEQSASDNYSEASFVGTGGIRFGRPFAISLRGSYLLGFDGNDYITVGAVIHLGSGGGNGFKSGGRGSRVGTYSRGRRNSGRAATWSQRLFRINKPSIQRDRPTPFHRTYYR